MISIDTLRVLGLNPQFLNSLGNDFEEFEAQVINDPSIQAQYTEDSIQEFLTPSYDPLPISGEIEYMLGIPALPVKIEEDLQQFYYAVRQQKYKYKLMLLIGFVTPSLNLADMALRMGDFNLNPKIPSRQCAISAVGMLTGHWKFDLNALMIYPFINKHAFEQTTIPNNEFWYY